MVLESNQQSWLSINKQTIHPKSTKKIKKKTEVTFIMFKITLEQILTIQNQSNILYYTCKRNFRVKEKWRIKRMFPFDFKPDKSEFNHFKITPQHALNCNMKSLPPKWNTSKCSFLITTLPPSSKLSFRLQSQHKIQIKANTTHIHTRRGWR